MASVVCLAWCPAAGADAVEAVNWARVHGCRPAAPAPLRYSAVLSEAAQRVAGGRSLQASLSSVGYLSARAAAVHLSGAVSDADVGRILTADYCASLADPGLAELGALRRGHEVWLVLAAPLALPEGAAVSRQILARVNAARATGARCGTRAYPPAPPLLLDATLSAAAAAHSQDMAAHGEFEHRGHDGSTPSTRLARAGFGPVLVAGENIAAGPMTPATVAQGWLASPPHCENIMDPRFTLTGIAFAVSTASDELVYWTQDFAAPRAAR